MEMLPVICLLIVANLCRAASNNTVNIGVILDSESWEGKMAQTAIKLAVDDANNHSQLLNGTRLLVHLRDAQSVLQAVFDAVDLLEREVVAIIATQTSEAVAIVSDLGEAAKVPILSFSATSPLLSNQRFPYFVRMAHNDGVQMKAIAALVKAYGWKRIVFLHSDNDFGFGAVSSLSDALRDIGSEIVYTSMISSSAEKQSIREELYKLMAMESRVFVLHLPSGLGVSLFREAQEIGMMEAGYVWITTHGFTSLWDYVVNPSTMASMQGLLGVKTHFPNSDLLKDFAEKWERQFKLDNPNLRNTEPNLYGLLAYDTVFMIAQTIGKLRINESFSFWTPSSRPPLITNYSNSIKVFQQGRRLLQEILLTSFTGLSGPIKLNNGEMEGSIYEIVNVVGKSYHVVGYWPYKSNTVFMTFPVMANEGLGPVIWPGRSTKVPRGWVIPTNGKRLKIAVPRKALWKEFVNVTLYPDRNKSEVTGFCIDIFKAAVRLLDYELQYDLLPYPPNEDNFTDWSYDDLVRQIYLKNYDAAVGDITIRAERSEIVEFTQPFTETVLVLVAPTTILQEANNAWAFLVPFSPEMWLTTAVFVIYTGLVVWLLEHRINPAFRGKPITQVVTVLWFGLSTVFNAHRERIRSSLSRAVIIVWLFVALVLTSSYTASLTSRLTEQRIAPLIDGIGNFKVGYQGGSFVGCFLRDHLGVAQKNLKSYSSRKAYEEALSKGPKNGGVDAILDEIPYVRAFLSGRCDYSMVGRTYKSGGFGFVFPKGSALVPDISKAILNLAESSEYQEIETKYFIDSVDMCRSENSKRLDVGSFWGLYIFTGAVSSLALIVFFCQSLINFMKDSNAAGKDSSMWEYLKSFANYVLYQEEVSCPPVNKLETLHHESNPTTMESLCEELEHQELDAITEDENAVSRTSSLSIHKATYDESPSKFQTNS